MHNEVGTCAEILPVFFFFSHFNESKAGRMAITGKLISNIPYIYVQQRSMTIDVLYFHKTYPAPGSEPCKTS